jgi:membrane protease YdiL (CAAX protease family)
MYFFSESTEIRTAFVIIGTLVFFYLYYYIAHSSVLKKAVYKNSTGINRELRVFFSRKLAGFVLLGIIPAILYVFFLKGSFGKFGFTIAHFFSNLFIITGLTFIIAFLLFIVHKKNPGQNTLQIKADQWSNRLFVYNILGWIIYLLAYEFLFRGILLFECYESFGFWPAVAINITLYSAIHMVNGKDQAIGALLFGGIACYFTLSTGTVLIPLFMHIALSGFSDYFSIKMNPDIGFIKSVPVKSEKL